MQRKINYHLSFTKLFALLVILLNFFILANKIIFANNTDFLKHYFPINKIEKDFQITYEYNVFENIIVLSNSKDKMIIYLNENQVIFNYKLFHSRIPIFTVKNNKVYISDFIIYKFFNDFFIPEKNISYYKNYFKNYSIDVEIVLGESQEQKNNINNESKTKDESKKIGNNLLTYAKKEIIEYRKIKYIIIDPGHGGKDPGAVYNGLKEKDINLYIAKKLYTFLKKVFPDINICLTRDKDVYLTLEQRVKIANKYNTENYTGIFISLHANASPFSKKANGLEIYYLDYNLADEKIKNLVKYENKDINNPIIGAIINRLLNEELIYESRKIAQYIFDNYKKYSAPIKPKSIYGAPFYVLAYTSIPSVLIELGYISNIKDSKNILSKKFINSLFISIEKGLKEYINEYNNSKGFKNIEK